MPDDDAHSHELPLDGAGHRTARGRVANLLCGLRRDAATDHGEKSSVDLAQSMARAASRLGLTPIHFLATLKHLGAEGLIATAGRTVAILDLERLQALAEPDPSRRDHAGYDAIAALLPLH